MADKVEWLNKLGNVIQPSKGGQLKGDAAFSMRESLSDGSLDTMARRPADPEEELRWMAQEVRGYVEAVLNSLAANVPKAVVLCQVEKSKEDMLNKLYSSIRNASTFLLLLCFLFFIYAAVNISAATPVAFEGCSLPLLPPYCHGALSCCFCLCWQWFLLNHVLVAVLVCMAWCLVSKLLLLVWAISCAAADKACAACSWRCGFLLGRGLAAMVLSTAVNDFVAPPAAAAALVLNFAVCVAVWSWFCSCLELIGAGFDALCCCICSYAVWYCFGLIVAVLCGRFGFPIVV
ncbi:dynamin GTPase [Sarracenia purpurea var. burkii]